MNQDYYQYIVRMHQKQLEISRINTALSNISTDRPALLSRTLLFISDALLILGQRIRPTGLVGRYEVLRANDGTFEAKAKGC
jgi:hypothetical protein